MAPRRIRILDPVARPPQSNAELAPRARSVAGSVIGLLSNGWRSFDAILKSYSELAAGKHEARGVLMRGNPSAASSTPTDTMEELVRECNAVVVGIGH